MYVFVYVCVCMLTVATTYTISKFDQSKNQFI